MDDVSVRDKKTLTVPQLRNEVSRLVLAGLYQLAIEMQSELTLREINNLIAIMHVKLGRLLADGDIQQAIELSGKIVGLPERFCRDVEAAECFNCAEALLQHFERYHQHISFNTAIKLTEQVDNLLVRGQKLISPSNNELLHYRGQLLYQRFASMV